MRCQRVLAWIRSASPENKWLGGSILIFAGCLFVFVFMDAICNYPIDVLESREVASLQVYDAWGEMLRQEMSQSGVRETWVSLKEISPYLIEATLASEDKNFFEHKGVDIFAILRAAWLNLKNGEMEFGGSTITMQLVALTIGRERTLTGKVRQLFLARDLERQLGKQEILENYLNRAYYGNGAWGVEQASQFYFGKPAFDLSIGEAALLAVIPRGPSLYNPFENLDGVLRRRERILGLMKERGYIGDEDRKIAVRTSPLLQRNPHHFRAPHFVQLVKTRLPESFQTAATVKTTLDLTLQRHVEIAVARHVDRLVWRNLTQAAVVVMRNRDGAVLAMVGSRNFGDASQRGAFNGTTARLRPGSTLKPFVYGTAFEMGDTPATIAYDVVLPRDAHQFYTKDVRSHGFARYRESLAGSYNLSAVHTLQRVGISPVLDKLRAAGVATLDRPDEQYDWGLAIGHADVRLLDLVGAFSVFGRAGRPVIPRLIDRARNVRGRQWKEALREGPQVFSEEIAYLIFDILSDPDARRPMFGMSVPMNLPFKVALKTGTTKAYTDLWALGVTLEYTVGVWAGNFDGQPTDRVRSVQGATPLMRATYAAIAARYGNPSAPERPQGVVSLSICPLSGKLPGPQCENRKEELFVEGHAPREKCDWHQSVCGQPTVVYPEEIRSWASYFIGGEKTVCASEGSSAALRIVEPIDGAKFILEPHRPARLQRPPLAALPADAEVKWAIDGEDPEEWIPQLGRHRVTAMMGEISDTVSIIYER